MQHPALASVFYISGSGGPTLVVQQQCNREHTMLIPEKAAGGTLLEVDANCWATFDGSLLHGVCNTAQCQKRVPDLELDQPADQDERRITLLVNFWVVEIQDCESMSQELSQDEQWAYGECVSSKLWGAPNKRSRLLETYDIDAEEVNQLYSYDLTGDQDTSECSECDSYVDAAISLRSDGHDFVLSIMRWCLKCFKSV
jgi:hypothetical protein